MLSRAAERVYWTGRYLERAENTARIVQQYSQLLLDLPEEVGVGWRELVTIFGAERGFAATGAEAGETTILNFLLADPASTGSLLNSIRMARDNVRNLRDLLPQESWENINELHQAARARLALSAIGENRFEVLADCIGRCQQVNGILAGTMSHHSPFHFLTLGQNVERADMTTRIIDVAAAYLRQNEPVALRFGSTLWTNVLKSVSGFQMYRQYQRPQVVGTAVIDFLLDDRAFPRAIRACLRTASASAAALPKGARTIDSLAAAEGAIVTPVPPDWDAADVSGLMDKLQRRLGKVHAAVAETWFLPGMAT